MLEVKTGSGDCNVKLRNGKRRSQKQRQKARDCNVKLRTRDRKCKLNIARQKLVREMLEVKTGSAEKINFDGKIKFDGKICLTGNKFILSNSTTRTCKLVTYFASFFGLHL